MNTKGTSMLLGAVVMAAALLVGRLDAQQSLRPASEHKEHKIFAPDEIKYQPGPASLPAGAQFAVIEGDPAKEGMFTMRIKLPANYRIPPHTHPKVERVTVLEGELKIGMGRQYNEQAMTRLGPGGFFAMPPGMEHFAGTDSGTVIQLNSNGPWAINYINPADDPRQRGR